MLVMQRYNNLYVVLSCGEGRQFPDFIRFRETFRDLGSH